MQKIKYLVIVFVLLGTASVQAQITSDSPFSREGVGVINEPSLPYNRGMGGLSMGLTNGLNINMANPAANSNIYLSTIDAGLDATYTNIKSSNGSSEQRTNGSLSYIGFAFPVTSQSFKSALSFGLIPFSKVGYNFNTTTLIDTIATKNSNYGEGGINKLYLGYGAKIGEHFSVGANVDYYFGDIMRSRTTEFTNTGAISSKVQDKNYSSGIGLTYGLQYDALISRKTRLVVGYAGTLNSNINFDNESIATRFRRDADGNESPAIDTLYQNKGNSTFKLPFKNSLGFVIQEDNHWLVGVDYRMANWSKATLSNIPQAFVDTWGVSVGGQIIPNINAIGGYLNKVEYRLGFSYDKNYILANNKPVNQMKVSAGFGLPLALSRLGNYKLNVALEYGKRGDLKLNGVQENFFGVQLGFMLNEKWFQKVRFD